MLNKTIKLNSGYDIPVIGLGTWKSERNVVGNTVEFAIGKANYRHIDCASIYGNEKEIGNALKNLGKSIKREDLFITSKLWNTMHKAKDVEKACKESLWDLGLEYLDLYLIHWGLAFSSSETTFEKIPISQTWNAMEELVEKGLVKSIGVSNFTTMMIYDLLSYAKIKPAVNQIELHPYNTQSDFVRYCKQNGIAVTAYSPLGRHGVAKDDREAPNIFEEEIIKNLSRKYNKSESQILLNWALKRGTIAIPKSTSPKRILENINIFDFELSNEEMKKINSLNRNYRFVNPVEWWDIPYFS